MKQFDHVLNWRLLSGSHKFPGPDGGTCINEAAIIAAGFKYREISSATDCPPCFSRVISDYAIRLNDTMPNDLRQKLLMPFVTRLAGTADTDDVEIRRATYIAIHTVRRILPISLRLAGLDDHAEKCEQVDTAAAAASAAANAAAYAAAYAAKAAYVTYTAAKAAYAAAAAADAVYAAATNAAYAAAYAAKAAYAAAYAAKAAYAAYAKKEIFTIAVEILDGAIKLGKQADPIDTALVCSRLEQAKQLVLAD